MTVKIEELSKAEFIEAFGDVDVTFEHLYKSTLYFKGKVKGKSFVISVAPNDMYEAEYAVTETVQSIVDSAWNLEEIDISIKGKYLD